MRRLVCFLAFVAVCTGLHAQTADDEQGWPPDEQVWYSASEKEEISQIETHDGFIAPLTDDTDGIFVRLSRYDLNFVSYRARGYDERFSKRYLHGLDVTSSDRYPDYGFYSALGYASISNTESAFTDWLSYFVRPAGTVTSYGIHPGLARDGLSATANYTGRRYRANIRIAGAGSTGKDGRNRYAFKAQRRWGRDAHIGGVFTDAGSASLSFHRDFHSGHSLTLFAMVAPSLQGTKNWATKEAFELTGNPYYNPSWGYFKGKELNSRMRRDLTPVVVASYHIPDKTAMTGTSYTVTAGYRFGERSRSGLAWFDARNPAPDYYMNMPSYFTDKAAADEVAEMWRSGSADYTQLDWMHMWEANILSDTTAGFVLEERVERIDDLQAVLSAYTGVDSHLSVNWGLRLRGGRSNYFKRVADMLGGDYILDVDQFLIDDRYYGSKYLNDVRNPGRKVRHGDRFGYDYDIRRGEAALFIGGRYAYNSRWMFVFAGELAFKSLERKGNYEKQTFPGALSYGKSGRLGFTTYALEGSARYRLSLHHTAWLHLLAADMEPSHEDIFLNPASHNFTAATENMALYSAGLRYNGFIAGFLTLEMAAYFTQSRNGSEILRYYDDLYADYSSDDLSGYSVMTMRGIDRRNMGIEVGIGIYITSRLKLSLAGAAGSHTYTSDPSVAIRADVNLHERLSDGRSYLSGYISSPSPQAVFMSSLTWSTPSRWRVELSWNYAGMRYVSLSPVRRTGRIADLASAPEMRREFRTQERLPDASTLSLYVSKGFVIAGHYMYASLSVDNIMDRRIIYGGYEQHRIRKEGTGINRTYSPFPSKYSYSYPRSFYLTVSANF